MGGSGGGSFSSVDFADLEKRILERLQGLAKSANRILFACEEEDQRSLASHMARAGIVENEKILVAVGPKAAPFVADMDSVQLLVTFSNSTKNARFLDALVEAALAAKKQGIHVKAQPEAVTPSKILAYRWRTMTWDELISLLK